MPASRREHLGTQSGGLGPPWPEAIGRALGARPADGGPSGPRGSRGRAGGSAQDDVPGPGAPPAIADFDLTPGGRLVGVVVERGTRRPIPAAQVTVEGTPASLGIPIRNEATADDQGNFVLAALGEGPTSISAMAPEHHARVISVPPIPDGESRGPITIEATPVAAGEEPRVELAGIGAMLEKRGEVLQVTMVAPGGGAAEVGLSPGDEVLFIDGVSVKPMTLRDAVPLVRGPEGTTVTLVVNKAGGGPGTSMTINVPRRLVRG